jgi:hypothetical protein
MNYRANVVVACLSFLAACGGAPDGADAKPTHYADMTFDDRAVFMNEVVLPRMKATFTAFDAKFANMTCTTCHGEGVTTGTYAMPSAGIPKLPASEEAFFEHLKDPEYARWSQFMMDKVWPEMASLLEVPMFDAEKQTEGFSCSNCHQLEAAH